jgi:basic membrane lipoprotein Med (substrate-binding protein (PBP1-ABC) superfamily)
MSELEAKKRMSDEEYMEQVVTVKRIAVITDALKSEVVNLKGKSVKMAYENSVSNLEKKNELYSKDRVSFRVTDEEKELLRKIRAGEVTVPSVSAANTNESNGEVQENVSRKGKGKHQ